MNTSYAKKAGLLLILFLVMLIVLYSSIPTAGSVAAQPGRQSSPAANAQQVRIYVPDNYKCVPDSLNTCAMLQRIGGSSRDTVFMFNGLQQSVYMYVGSKSNPKYKSKSGAFKDYLFLIEGKQEIMYTLKSVYKKK
ncbi:MAG: hypothetical protein INR73_07145 [Williamsia sp.]|nr:hypothetical protein [Williamsia sp.]